jgi:ATP-dependent protease ClpP protease subunit
MRIKIALRGEIGWSETATPDYLQGEFATATGRDVDLEIASPGGYVSDGIEMANMVRNYSGHVEALLTGFAASMASYIPMFANNVAAEDNAVFMIHNVSTGTWGDHRDLQKAADRAERLTALLAMAYVKKTGKPIEEIRALMDAETFFYGQEIVDEGFADRLVETGEDTDKAAAVELAAVAFASCAEQMLIKPEESDRLVAMLDISERANKGHSVNNPKKEKKMDPKLRAFLESNCGLAKDATDDEANALALQRLGPQAAVPAVPGATSTEVVALIQADQERCQAIESLGARAGMTPEAINTHKYSGSTVAVVQAEACGLMATALDKRTGDVPFSPAAIAVGSSSRDKFIVAAEEAVMIRAGIADSTVDVGANPLAGYSMVELARQALHIAGHKSNGDARTMLGQALTTSDLPNVLANVLNKSVFMGFDTAEESWSQWCSQGEVSDFKQNSSVRLSELGDLEEIAEGGEYKFDNLADGKETFQLGTYGKILRMSRQMLINDDLDIFSKIAVARGETAARKIGDLAYNVLIANAVMGDNVALFQTATHKNLNMGTAGAAAPSVTSLGEAFAAMRLQKDLKQKRRLQIRPEFWLGPVALETTMDKVLGRVIGTQAEPAIDVPARFRSLKVITEARLDDDSATAWYIAGARGKTVEVNFLRGSGRRPMLEQKTAWNTDGAEFKTTLDVEAHAMAFEALQKNNGA